MGLLTIGGAHLALEGMNFERRIQVEERERWYRHRNEPWWVVGEHRHCPPPPFGKGRDSFFIASPFGEETGTISFFQKFSMPLVVFIYAFMLMAF